MKTGIVRILSLLALPGAAANAVSVTGFNASVWPRTDAAIGVAGYVIEDFEDTTLASGLQVQVTPPSIAGYGPVSTLPFTFSAAQDCCGAFNSSLMWDGSHGLINRPFVPIANYANDGGWSDVSFLFQNGVTSVGFSYGQAEANVVIRVDLGSGNISTFNSTSFVGTSGGRNGYLRFDAGPGETIYGITMDNQSGNHDGILYDHVAFLPVPLPPGVPDSGATSGLIALGMVTLGVAGRRLRRR